MAVLSGTLKPEEASLVADAVLGYYLYGGCGAVDCEVLLRIYKQRLQPLMRNKVLTPVSVVLEACCSYSDEVTRFRVRRYKVYLEACRELASAFREHGVRMAIIKTVRPVATDIADIDIVVKASEKAAASRLLAGLGYRLRKESLEQDLWTKIVEGIVVDVELHTSIAIAGFTYVEEDFVFNNIVERDGLLLLDESIEVPLEAAHAVMKDLEVRLSDVISFVAYVQRMLAERGSSRIALVILSSRLLGLSTALAYMSLIAGSLEPYVRVFENLAVRNSVYGHLLGRLAVVREFPLKPSMQAVALSFLEKFLVKASRIGFWRTVSEALTILRSSGLDALTSYFSGKTVTKDVFEDRAENM